MASNIFQEKFKIFLATFLAIILAYISIKTFETYTASQKHRQYCYKKAEQIKGLEKAHRQYIKDKPDIFRGDSLTLWLEKDRGYSNEIMKISVEMDDECSEMSKELIPFINEK